MYELHRHRRREPELLQAKADQLRVVDDEVRGLADALEEGETLTTLTARGLVAACTACGRLMGSRDRFCPSCGAAAGAGEAPEEERPEPMEPPDFGETEEFNVLKAMAEEEAPAWGGGPEPDGGEAEPGGTDAGRGEAGREAESAVAAAEREPVAAAHREPDSAGPTPPAKPTRTRPAAQALLPRAQRRMRAGRRIARQWLAQRRPDP